MKKNLRIASAAAAALLAVAPVAASTVSTVLADTTVTVEGGTQTNPTTSAELILNVTNAATLVVVIHQLRLLPQSQHHLSLLVLQLLQPRHKYMY